MSDAGTEAKQEEERIVVKLKSQDGTEKLFRMKRTTPMGKLMNAYCCHLPIQLHKLRFIFGNRRIGYDNTPLELGMEDGAEIHVIIRECGC